MRKLILILFLLFALPTLVFGWMNVTTVGGGTPATGCTYTLKDSATATEHVMQLGVSNVYAHVAHSFTAGSNYSLKRLADIEVAIVGDPVAKGLTTVTVYICTDNAGLPSSTCTQLGTIDVATQLTTTYADFQFDYPSGYSISASSIYWIRFIGNGYDDEGADDYVAIHRNGGGSGGNYARSANGTSWASVDSTSAINFQTFSCE